MTLDRQYSRDFNFREKLDCDYGPFKAVKRLTPTAHLFNYVVSPPGRAVGGDLRLALALKTQPLPRSHWYLKDSAQGDSYVDCI
ncbi:hypothetical protein RRG08_012917 [Elysia crispata]|uniref:Uncharacterized protein n=1 Tax=Elysia crispata TaxID=231223 RepID=A0AAE1A118_9GAST|nr:hypothetical protein RRG08_012917 [Elysia crispata]